MSESTYLASFMKQLRQAVPDAVIIKHHDASMIGLPDCSITFNDHIWWVEAKLWKPPVRWSYPKCRAVGQEPNSEGVIEYEKIAAESPTQFALMKKMAKAGRAYYIFWVNKTKRVDIWHPVSGSTFIQATTGQAVARLKAIMMFG